MNIKKAFSMALIASVCTTLAACSSSTGNGSKATAALSDYTVRMGYYNCDHMIAGPVGEAMGYYTAHGLKVELTGNGKVPEAMAAAQMDAGLVGISSIIGAIGKGSPVKISAMNHTGGSRYLVVANDVNGPDDLYGQKVAFTPVKSGDLILNQTIGLSLDPAKYETVNISGDSNKYLALTQGEIKGYICCDPWGSMAEYKGTGKILDTYNDSAKGMCCGFTMSKDFLQNHPDHAVALLHAYVDANKYCYLHPLGTARIFAKYYNVPEEVALMTMYNKCVKEGRTLSWKFEEARLSDSYDGYVQMQYFDVYPKLEECYDLSAYKKANLDDFDAFIKNEVEPIFPSTMTYEEYKAKAIEIDGPLAEEAASKQ